MENRESVQKKWDLSDLYSSNKADTFLFDQQQINILTTEFENFRSILTPTMSTDDFHTVLQKYEAYVTLAYRLSAYTELWFSEDTQNSEAMTLYAKIESILTEAGNRTLFFGLWWKSLTDEEALRFILQSPGYEYFLAEIRHSKPYTLEETSEQIINLKNMTGFSALTNLYETLTNRYQFTLIVDGKEVKLTRDGLMVYAHDPSPELRKAAYQELYRVYGDDGKVLGQIYQNIVRDWYYENVHLRKYNSAISTRNLSNDIPDEVVNLLLQTCKKNKALFQKYFQIKKKLIGVEKLNRYDIYAPTIVSDKKITYSDAVTIVQNAFSEFDPKFSNMAMKIISADHVDSEIRHGKRGGAFCLTAGPALTPWVLLNYQGKASDVSTLAHELGHAVHSLSAADKNIFEQQACLPLAETASTFAEMVLTDFMLKNEPDPELRRDILIKQMDDAYATIQRQAYFALFEKQAHEMIPNGADIEELNRAYLENLTDQFGDSIIINEEFRWEWVSIPHIYATPFYVYAYSFGQLLVLSLYRKYKEEGSEFIPKYWQILSSGGSESPESILKKSGFNFYDETFWQGGFDVLQERLNFLEKNL
ncbi:MAG: M3 family oligoendopeptidase [Flexilinea sp.]